MLELLCASCKDQMVIVELTEDYVIVQCTNLCYSGQILYLSKADLKHAEDQGEVFVEIAPKYSGNGDTESHVCTCGASMRKLGLCYVCDCGNSEYI